LPLLGPDLRVRPPSDRLESSALRKEDRGYENLAWPAELEGYVLGRVLSLWLVLGEVRAVAGLPVGSAVGLMIGPEVGSVAEES
jgi:hypothetical protein